MDQIKMSVKNLIFLNIISIKDSNLFFFSGYIMQLLSLSL